MKNAVVKSEEKAEREFNDNISAEEMMIKAHEYFNNNDIDTWNVANMCLYMNISIDKYKEYRSKKGYGTVTQYCQTKLLSKYLAAMDDRYPTGAVAILKNDFGYTDKKNINTVINGNLTIEQVLKGAKVKA